MAAYAFIGTWEVVAVHTNHNDNTGLEGVRFRLDESGDVTWTVSEEVKSNPLFSCETYEVYSTSVLGVILRFGAYAGHIIEFKSDQIEPRDSVVLSCEGWCMVQCKRVTEDQIEPVINPVFSLLPALEDGYFHDLIILAANKKQFRVHSTILQLHGSDLAWLSQPPPFQGLPEEVLGTLLHFLYAECLPPGLTESTARQVVAAALPYPCLTKLVNMCRAYLKNMALKQQIIGLVSDMHTCANQIIEHFNNRHCQSASDNITSNPAKLCNVVKQSVRETAVAGAKLLLLCDLFAKRKNELSREERHEIIRYARSRLPIFMSQLHRFLQAVKATFSNMSATQRQEVATYLIPEIEVILDTISMLVVEVKSALEQIIQVLSPGESCRTKSGVGDILGKSLRNVLHIRELTKLRNFHGHITCSLGLLLHKKESFNEMTAAQKVRSVARNLEQLIEELPILLLRLEEVTAALDERLEWREFKFCFKVGTSKVSGILNKLLSHRSTLSEVITQVCELVQRESFTQSMHTLGLLDSTALNTSSQAAEGHQRPGSGRSMTTNTTPKQQQGSKLNLVESLCVSPSANNSILSKLSLQLLKSGLGTDMEFEVVGSADQTHHSTEADTAAVASEADRCTIRAHRVIVAARCDWFRRALLSGMREAIDKKIIIHDSNSFLFRTFLEYLYSGRLRHSSLTTDQLAELLLLSDRYEVDSLKQVCEYALRLNMDEENVLYLLSMADQFNASLLRSGCLAYISQHPEVADSELFSELPPSLQAEVYDLVLWAAQPAAPRKSTTTEELLPSSPTSDLDETVVDMYTRVRIDGSRVNKDEASSETNYLDGIPILQDTARIETCLAQLRNVLGDEAPRDRLVQFLLAADYDINRAINFYYTSISQ
ncbi:uncharacterized protein CBL_09838 [Carabus blaptoides fortunei]